MPDTNDLSRLTIDRSAGAARGRCGRWGRRLAALAALAALGFGGYRLLNPVPRVAVVTVSRVFPSQTFTVLNASGYVVAQRKAAVASKGAGRLVWLGVEEGSAVKEGQVIARLESDDLQAAAAQARAALAVSRANSEVLVPSMPTCRGSRLGRGGSVRLWVSGLTRFERVQPVHPVTPRVLSCRSGSGSLDRNFPDLTVSSCGLSCVLE